MPQRRFTLLALAFALSLSLSFNAHSGQSPLDRIQNGQTGPQLLSGDGDGLSPALLPSQDGFKFIASNQRISPDASRRAYLPRRTGHKPQAFFTHRAYLLKQSLLI